MSGTELVYHTTRYPVSCYTMSGTELAYVLSDPDRERLERGAIHHDRSISLRIYLPAAVLSLSV
eukprot:320207-Rhodomonas_salina.2